MGEDVNQTTNTGEDEEAKNSTGVVANGSRTESNRTDDGAILSGREQESSNTTANASSAAASAANVQNSTVGETKEVSVPTFLKRKSQRNGCGEENSKVYIQF